MSLNQVNGRHVITHSEMTSFAIEHIKEMDTLCHGNKDL